MSDKKIGKAALISMDFDTEDIKYSVLTTNEVDNPIQACWDLSKTLIEDFPNHDFNVVANDVAKEINTNHLLNAFGLADDV